MTYPVREIEYGTWQWLRREIGGRKGFGYDESTWTHEQQGVVKSIIDSGYLQMLYPPPLPSETPQAPHQWSFLRPVNELQLVVGQKTYDLPEDFSGTLGEFTLQQ